MQQRSDFMLRQYDNQLRLQRILVDIEGALRVYRRNDDGIFVIVPEDDDETESEAEEEPPNEEDEQQVARRLGFESDSDGYISDDLMRSLLTDE